MELQVIAGATPLTVADAVFDAPFNEGLVHQLVVRHLANARTATAHQKTRAEVRGGGKKPWKQKGSGRARAGSIRSPLWRGGGKTFPAGGENYTQKLNKKMYRAGMRCIVSELHRQGRLTVIEAFGVTEPRTRAMVARLAELGLDERPVLLLIVGNEDRQPRQADLLDQLSLIDLLKTVRPDEIYNLGAMSFVPTSWQQPVLTAEFDLNLELAARNLPGVDVEELRYASPVALVRPERVVATREAVAALVEGLA